MQHITLMGSKSLISIFKFSSQIMYELLYDPNRFVNYRNRCMS